MRSFTNLSSLFGNWIATAFTGMPFREQPSTCGILSWKLDTFSDLPLSVVSGSSAVRLVRTSLARGNTTLWQKSHTSAVCSISSVCAGKASCACEISSSVELHMYTVVAPLHRLQPSRKGLTLLVAAVQSGHFACSLGRLPVSLLSVDSTRSVYSTPCTSHPGNSR